MLYTAQYRYPGKDRLDITVKGSTKTGRLFAPTWNMVNGVKNGSLTEEGYTGQYYNLLIKRFDEAMLRLVDKTRLQDVTVVCFCPAGAFCHRLLLVEFLKHNWGAVYGGERIL